MGVTKVEKIAAPVPPTPKAPTLGNATATVVLHAKDAEVHGTTLRYEKDDVKEVPRGMECGIKLSGFNDVKKDDVLEAYKIEEVARTL